MKPHLPTAVLIALSAGSSESPALDLECLNRTSALPGVTINGIDPGDRCGFSVSCAGDVNGDGVDDLIIGADNADPNGLSNAGESYVVFGGAGFGASGVIELSSLNGLNGFVINGIDQNDRSGVTVSMAGDVNDDGVNDLLVGASGADPNSNSNAGETYVIFGSPLVGTSGVVDLSSLDGTAGFVINGIDAFDSNSMSVSSAGDVNDDGVDDLFIGASTADPNGSSSGESYVVFGRKDIGKGGALELSSLNGPDGFVINGVSEFDLSGSSVSCAGDINGDGVSDLLLGALGADPNANSGSGASYVVFGGAGVGAGGAIELSSLDGSSGFVINGVAAGDASGRSVSSAGDVNDDGVDDLFIGALSASPNGNSSGASYVVFGGLGIGAAGAVELSSLDGSNGFVINGIEAGDVSGISLSAAGDVNADGVSDLVIGASQADRNGNSTNGESYVVFGGSGVGAGGVIELSSLDGTNGFALTGVSTGDFSGRSVSGAGDLNADGVDDVVISADSADPNGNSGAGGCYVIFGSPTLGQPIPPDLTGNGCVDSADLGALLAAWGQAGSPFDLDGDGVVDSSDLGILLAAWTG